MAQENIVVDLIDGSLVPGDIYVNGAILDTSNVLHLLRENENEITVDLQPLIDSYSDKHVSSGSFNNATKQITLTFNDGSILPIAIDLSSITMDEWAGKNYEPTHTYEIGDIVTSPVDNRIYYADKNPQTGAPGEANSGWVRVVTDNCELSDDQCAGVKANIALSAANKVVDENQLNTHIGDGTMHLTSDQNDAMDGANSPSSTNVFATMDDVIAGGSGGCGMSSDQCDGVKANSNLSSTNKVVDANMLYTHENNTISHMSDDQNQAFDNANAPSATNPVATMADVPTPYDDTALQASVSQNTTDIANVAAVVASHEGATNNPHNVTKDQVGLGNVDNTADSDKPISTATQTALDGKYDIVPGVTDNVVLFDDNGTLKDSGQTLSGLSGIPNELGKEHNTLTNTGTTGSSFWTPFVVTPAIIDSNISVAAGSNAMLVSPTIEDGVEITVPSGSTLVIL